MRRAHGISSAARRGPADEDPAPARRIARPGGVQRPVDPEAVHAGRVRELGEQVVDAAGVRAPHHRDADRVRTGGHLESDAAARRCPAHHLDALAVERDLHLVVHAHRRQAENADAAAPDAELVFGIEREHVLHQQAAARAERQPLAVHRLRQPARWQIGGEVGADRRIAHRQAGDLRRRRHVGLHQRRRDAEHAGHVVEALARVVAGQEGRGVHRQRQQIANGVGVLRPVQPVQHRRAGVGRRRGRPIDRGFHRGREPVERDAVRAWRVGRRHHAGPHLARDLLPHLRVLAGARHRQPVEREAAGLQPRVVAGDAVAIDDGLRAGGRRCGSRLGSRRRRLAAARRLCVSTFAIPAISSSAAASDEVRRLMVWRPAARAARSSPASAPRRPRRGRRPRPTAAPCALPCPSRPAARRASPAAR